MKGTQRVITCFIGALAITLLSNHSVPAQSDHLIVPGERIGPVRIGMLMDEVGSILGQPTRSWIDAGTGRRIIRKKYQSGLQVDMLDGPAPWVCAIYADGGNWQTSSGLRLGDSGYDLARKMGTNYTSRSTETGWTYAKFADGLQVSLQNRVVVEMWVWRPGHGCVE